MTIHSIPRFIFSSVCATAWVCSVLSLLPGCAGQVMPSGGPPDTIPPVIIRTYPDSNAIRVTPSHIELEFSKYVERRTVEEAVFISPYVGHLTYDWSGTEVTITFAEGLRKNTTYVLTVGTDVSDLPARGGNKMAHAYTLAFSTGDSIDQGMISGRVFDEHPDGVMVFAYHLHGVAADTLDPTHTRPQYIVQTGKDGTFRFRNIAFGPYRVVAVRDEYRNLLYDRQVDQYGVATEDPVVNAERPEVQHVWFRLSKEDTTRPFLANVTAVDVFHVLVRFSEPVDTLTLPRAVFSVVDTTAKGLLRIAVQYQNMGNQALVNLETAERMDSMKVYRLAVRGVHDRAGNSLDTNNAALTFNGPSAPDTVKPFPLVRGVADSARGLELRPVLEMDFRRPVDLSSAMHGISLRDSTAVAIPIEIRPRTPAEVFILPSAALKPLAWYTLRVSLDSLRDSKGAHWHDSAYALRFQTLDARMFGSIAGTLAGAFGGHRFVLTARTVDRVPQRSSAIALSAPGKFLIDQLPEGRYSIEAFEDLNDDGHYRAGLPHPYVPSARFVVYPDTVKVRARWSVEGVQLRFP
jgi:hypothetical protein